MNPDPNPASATPPSGAGRVFQALPRTRGCFVCGYHNPQGFGLDLHSDGRTVRMPVAFREEHAGFSGVVHGGLLTTVLDESMAWVIGVNTRTFAFAAELNVRFVRPVRPGVTMGVEAELMENRRGRLFRTRAVLTDPDGAVAAEATGTFLPIPSDRLPAMFADFVDDPSPWVGPAGPVKGPANGG